MAADFSPGWYVDPSDSTRIRYWQGSRWTRDTWGLDGYEHLVSAGPTPPVSIEPASSHDGEDDVFEPDTTTKSGDLSWVQLVMCLVAVAVTIAAGGWFAWTYLPGSWSDLLPR